ncbi:helix-turn-helix domain-containing protein [Nakamurella sp. YIM 132087]|uniref:Helix-turn-helix domain-containing protein n=1 Tax=Nakamurella alba TaxID=2665158 RepID=A0A7K1FU94_9ACTN|nr:helix-turn-helix transcriptional regulator [Nakamurella alba]MTD16404.1 helix-turn-helix domain-containing protein [Nakamurella alba]
MTSGSPVGEFLMSRRAAIEPEDVGLADPSRRRRVPGLRREEVAVLAGVSVDYYTKLEQGRVGTVSEQVLDAVETALRLGRLERLHLRSLLNPSGIHTRTVRSITRRARPELISMINALDPVPAVIHGPHLEVLGINRAGALLLDDFQAMPVAERNMARWMFLSPRARVVYRNWAEIAPQMVAVLRAAAISAGAAGDPDDHLAGLVAELATASWEFAAMWADYRLFEHTHGIKEFFHEAVGPMSLRYETLALPGDPGQTVILYTAPPASPSERRLLELGELALRPPVAAG